MAFNIPFANFFNGSKKKKKCLNNFTTQDVWIYLRSFPDYKPITKVILTNYNN